MDVKLTIHRTMLSTLLTDGGENLRMGILLHHVGAKVIAKDFDDKEVLMLNFGKIFRGQDGADGKSAYETAKDGGYTGTEVQFSRVLASLGNIDVQPVENSDNLISSGGVWQAIDDARPRWHKAEDLMIDNTDNNTLTFSRI